MHSTKNNLLSPCSTLKASLLLVVNNQFVKSSISNASFPFFSKFCVGLVITCFNLSLIHLDDALISSPYINNLFTKWELKFLVISSMVSTCPEEPLINLQIPSTIQFLPTPFTFEYNMIAMLVFLYGFCIMWAIQSTK